MKPSCLILLTAFAASAAVPRPEYPQPQFERSEWMNLNGPWQFEFDDANAGLTGHWWDGKKTFGRTITVPFCFESKLSGIADTTFHPWVWYRRTFTVPEAWNGRHVLLHFGAVDYRARVWVNGDMAGAHEGGNVPFVFDITDLLKRGENTVTVRAEDPPTDRYIPRGKQYWKLKSESIFYTRTSGIWQTVWMEPVQAEHIENVRIAADDDGFGYFHATLSDPKPGQELRIHVSFDNVLVATSTTPAADRRVWSNLGVHDPKLWSPEHPNLYDVTFELVDGGKVVDTVKSYFGFRTIGVDGNRVTINGRKIYMKMILDQGYWPESILTPPSDEAIQFDIKTTQAMGFNGARKHQKVEDPRYLYWADKMGLLVSSEMAAAYEFDPQAAERFTREWMAAVERDFNHPSIIIWAPINESWGVPDLRHDPRQVDYLGALYHLTHTMDSTRLVIDNEGWEHTDHTDLFAIHDYAENGAILADKYQDLGSDDAPIPDGGRPALIPGFDYNGAPLYLSEFGGIAFVPEGHKTPGKSWGYAGVEKTQDDAMDRMASLWTGIAALPVFGGYCYTQLTDVEQEINGLLTDDRKPKFPMERIKAMNDSIH